MLTMPVLNIHEMLYSSHARRLKPHKISKTAKHYTSTKEVCPLISISVPDTVCLIKEKSLGLTVGENLVCKYKNHVYLKDFFALMSNQH